MTPCTAEVRDVPRIVDLLAGGAPDTVPRGPDEVRRNLGRFLVLRDAGAQVVAVASVEPLGEDRAELRSVAVHPACRGRGAGRRLVRAALRRAASRGQELFCCSFRPEFFAGLGFLPAEDPVLDARSGRPSRIGERCRSVLRGPAAPFVDLVAS